MKRKCISLALGLLFTSMVIHAQNWDWVVQEGDGLASPYTAQPLDFGANSLGGFTVGKYLGTPLFGTITLTNSGNSDAFLCKTNDNTGSLIWVVRAGGAGADAFEQVLVVGNDIFVGGGYSGSITLYGTNTFSVSLSGGGRFLAKYNQSGVLQWAVNTTGSATVDDMAFDGSVYRVYTIGRSAGSVTRVEVASFDAATGALVWSRTSSGTGLAAALPDGIGADAGNVYVLIGTDVLTSGPAGSFSLAGSGSITCQPGQDLKLIKMDVNGSYLAHNNIGNPNPSATEIGVDLDCTASGDIYITGSYFGGTAYMTGGVSSSYDLTNVSGNDLFFAWYNSSLVIQWSRKLAFPGVDFPIEMVISGSDGYLLVRNVSNTATLVGTCSTGIYADDVLTNEKWYVVKYEDVNTLAPFIDWSAGPSDVSDDDAMPVNIAPVNGRALLAGFNENSTILGSTTVSGNGGVYLARASKITCFTPNEQATAGISEHENGGLFSVFPNPGTGIFTLNLQSTNDVTLEVFDVTGRRIQNKKLQGSLSHTLDLSGHAKGIYTLTLTGEGKRYSRKIILE